MGQIIITIDAKTGKSSIKANGYTGATCKDKTKPFVDRLGKVETDEETSEMYQTVEQQQEQTNG